MKEEMEAYFLKNRRTNELICIGGELDGEFAYSRSQSKIKLIKMSETFDIFKQDGEKIDVPDMLNIIDGTGTETWSPESFIGCDTLLKEKYPLISGKQIVICKEDVCIIEDDEAKEIFFEQDECICEIDHAKEMYKVYFKDDNSSYSNYYLFDEKTIRKYFKLKNGNFINPQYENLIETCDDKIEVCQDIFIMKNGVSILWAKEDAKVICSYLSDGFISIHTELKDLKLTREAFDYCFDL